MHAYAPSSRREERKSAPPTCHFTAFLHRAIEYVSRSPPPRQHDPYQATQQVSTRRQMRASGGGVLQLNCHIPLQCTIKQYCKAAATAASPPVGHPLTAKQLVKQPRRRLDPPLPRLAGYAVVTRLSTGRPPRLASLVGAWGLALRHAGDVLQPAAPQQRRPGARGSSEPGGGAGGAGGRYCNLHLQGAGVGGSSARGSCPRLYVGPAGRVQGAQRTARLRLGFIGRWSVGLDWVRSRRLCKLAINYFKEAKAPGGITSYSPPPRYSRSV
jgi:hypothetical protein